jgi:hypothetical protein
MRINLPDGYETRRLDDGEMLIYSPGSVRHPETNEWLGRRTLLRFRSEHPGIIWDVEILARLDAYAHRCDTDTRSIVQGEMSDIFKDRREQKNA